jgi:glycolate oxidase
MLPEQNKYNRVSSEFITALRTFLREEQIIVSRQEMDPYSHDYTEDLVFFPEAVVFPAAAGEVAQILRLCNEYKIPATPRGAGTGLSGGALPVSGGLIISMERMNRILEIDKKNFQATVEPGVINQTFQEAAAALGLYYPPDPASRGSCSMGGNIAHNSGGPRAVKYGVTRDYVLNLEVVTPTGEIIRTGANTLKNSTGYSLTQLMLGSEGTLGIVTKIVLRLLPLPQHNLLMLASFQDAEKACAAVAEIFTEGIVPSALEFMEREGVEITVKRLGTSFRFEADTEAYLLVEVDGNNMDQLYADCEKINRVLDRFKAGEVLFAESSEEKERLWKIRRSMGETIKSESIYKEEDTVVPRASLPALLKGVKEIGKKYGFRSVCYGHAGDGNLHVNILKGNMSEKAWKEDLIHGIREIFSLCIKLGGTISGEHGIGYVQKSYMDIPFSGYHLELMQKIKKSFDPENILNPGKIFPKK